MSDNMQFRLILSNCVLIAFFYFNAFFLYPVVFKRRGVVLYIVTLIAAVFLSLKATSFVERTYLPLKHEQRKVTEPEKPSKKEEERRRQRWKDRKNGFIYFTIFPYIFIIGISISYRIIKDSVEKDRMLKEAENETLKTELTFLRSQVSPHFMFNVLNTLVSLARKKSDLIEPSLIQLSNLMRYMLYDSNDERIPVDQEIDYLKSYIDLQMLRFGDDVKIEMSIDQDLKGYDIEPMLLISFVENAFKHGVGMIEDPVIKIQLSIDRASHYLQFRVINKVSEELSSKDKSSGIGLNNMRRRLELLYKDRYTLETSQSEDIFVSDLTLKLK